jgi:hypothetical protein
MSVMLDFHLAGPYSVPPRPVAQRRPRLAIRAATWVGSYVAALIEVATYFTVFFGVTGGLIWLAYFAYFARR